MEEQSPKIMKNNDSNLRWLAHGSEICDTMNHQQSNNPSMDKFWEDQWSSRMEGWAALAKHAPATSRFTPQTCQSPSASESSFSLSTRDSPSLSAQSEVSPTPAKYALQSPDLSQDRCCKISLFYLDVKHAKPLPMENGRGEISKVHKQQGGTLLQETGMCENIQHASDLNRSVLLRNKLESFVKAKERLVQSPTDSVHGIQGGSDEGWLSDDSESWASASSRELSQSQSCDEIDDIPSSLLYEAPCIHPISHCHGQDERGCEEEEACHAAHRGIADQYDDENANISEKQSYDKCNDKTISCDNQGHLHKSIPVQSRFDDQTSAPALAPPGQLGAPTLLDPHAGGLETRYFNRYKSLQSRVRAKDPNVERQEGDVSSRRNADCSVGHQELPVQTVDEHQPFACTLFKAENLSSPEKQDFYESNLTKSGSSACTDSASLTEQHLKSPHSAAVENKYPSSSLHGHFRFVEQDGSQCYSFSVHDSDEVFFARACQPETESNDKHHECFYTFHSRRGMVKTKGGQKSWLRKEKLASSLVGKMKVVDAKHKHTENRCIDETCFVLYGESSQLPPENKPYRVDQMSVGLNTQLLKPTKSNLSKPTLDTYSQKRKERKDCNMSMPAATTGQGITRPCLHETTSRDDLSRHGSVDATITCCSKPSHVKQGISTTHMELAVIVITATVEEYKVTEKRVYETSHQLEAGWGAAFLGKGFKRGNGTGFLDKSSAASEKHLQQLNASSQDALQCGVERFQEHTDAVETYHKSGPIINEKLTHQVSCSEHKQPNMAVDLVVILPARHHGLCKHDGNCTAEDDDPHGPTALLECWQSGGNCHCGGWDMGCGLSVLKAATLKLHKKSATIALTNSDRINWIAPEKPLRILTQGCKQKRRLTLEVIQTGLYHLSFHARFSTLQAFATAVAIFHEQIAQR